jgi:Hypothetical methyltransferase
MENLDQGETNSAKKKKKKKRHEKKNSADDESVSKHEELSVATSGKKANFDVEKLKEALGRSQSAPSTSSTTPLKSSSVSDAKSRLKSSQFRFLNEKLYGQNGAQSLKMFSTDKVLKLYYGNSN